MAKPCKIDENFQKRVVVYEISYAMVKTPIRYDQYDFFYLMMKSADFSSVKWFRVAPELKFVFPVFIKDYFIEVIIAIWCIIYENKSQESHLSNGIIYITFWYSYLAV